MATKIKPINHCPTSDAWAEELQRDCIAPRWVAHLEQCRDCQLVLEGVAADRELWFEAQETLADRPVDLAHITESIAPLSMDASRDLLKDPLCEFEVAQLQRLLPSGDASRDKGANCLSSYPPCEPIARIGRYELEQLIGRGGMGLVFRAWDTQLHRVVAVKTLGMSLWSMPSARERFIREGRAAAMLSHANIVPMYDVINDPPVPALVMQYIAGPTLDQWIQEHGPMNWSQALRIALQLADALCAAHAEGLVHRDIKPGNVLLEADGTRALLTDFGLVRAMDDATLTQSGLLAGTPHFMSPEQARGEDVDGRSDLFSLGSLLYYLISGQTPFRGRESMSVLNSLCHASHQPLVRLSNELPREVSRLVDKLLQKQPSLRPTSSQEVRDTLRKLLAAEKRLKPKRPMPKHWKETALVSLAAMTAAGLWMVPWYLRAPDHFRNSHVVSYPAVSAAAEMNAAAMGTAQGMTMPDGPQSNSAHVPFVKVPAPNASELDALAEEVYTLEWELDNQPTFLDSRVGSGESLVGALREASEELEQIQVGLRLPSDENAVPSDSGER